MFFVIGLDGDVAETASFKCSAAEFERLTAIDGIVAAPYLARASWVQVQDFAALPARELEARIRASHTLVLERLPLKVGAALKAAN